MSTRTNFQIALNKLEAQRADDRIPHVLNEEALIDELKLEFINSRSISNAFKLTAKDLGSLDYKKEIRFLISRRWFPLAETSNIFLPKLTTAKALNKSLSILEASNPAGFEELLQFIPSGTGPGETLMYYLLDKAVIGGGNSAGIDLIDDGTPYEIKAVNRSKTGVLHNFKLGGTVDISDIQSKIMKLKKELLLMFPKIKEGEKTGINNDHLKGFKNKKFIKLINDRNDLESYEDLEKAFAKIAYDGYFKAHPIIFMGSKSASKADKGRIFDILNVKEKQIKIHHVTSSTIKPGVLSK
tara:strand:+ start:4484 stop:5377 length:894 start_codon:yes stop_codon:yes gene_type:complete